MTKKLIKKLRSIAEKLPVEKEGFNAIISGRTLKKQKITLVKGKDVKEDHYYQNAKAQRPVNHLRRMKEAYKKGGWDAVHNYVKFVKKRNNAKNDIQTP